MVRKWCVKGIDGLFLTVFGVLGILLFWNYQKEWTCFIGCFLVAGGLCVLFGRWSCSAGTRQLRTLTGVLWAVMFGLMLLAGWQLRVSPGADWWSTYNGAVEWATYGEFQTGWFKTYFNRYPNNILAMLVNAGLYKVMTVFHIYRFFEASVLLNIVSLMLSITWIVWIARGIRGECGAALAMTLSTFFLPFYLNAPVFYTDPPALLCLSSALLLAMKSQEGKDAGTAEPQRKNRRGSKPLWLLGAAGFLLAVGYKMKGTLAVLLIAFILWCLLQKNWKGLAVVLFGAGIGLAVINGVIAQTGVIQEDYEELEKMPYTHWIMMGLKGNGGYNGEDVNFTLSFPTYEEKKEQTTKEIIRRLQEYGIAGTGEHLYRKVIHGSWKWSDLGGNTFYYSEPMQWGMAQELFHANGKYQNVVRQITNSIWLLCILLMLRSGWNGFKKNRADQGFLMRLALLGIFAFLLLWETEARYLFAYSPCILLLAVGGLEKDRNNSVEYTQG